MLGNGNRGVEQNKIKLEDFFETVKSVDMALMLERRDDLYANDVRNNYKLLNEWRALVNELDPAFKQSRLHHFLFLSGTPEGFCLIDDLAGPLSAERYLLADLEGRRKIIEELQSSAEEKDRVREAA